MELKTREGGKKFITVLADGKFHQTVPAGTEGAIVRKYEDKDGFEQIKTELVFDEVSGIITKYSFEDGDFGKSLKLEIDSDGVVSLSTASSFGEDFMKKFPNIDLAKEVRLVPYSFADERGKARKGMTVYQSGGKIESAYWDSATKKSKGGIPEPTGDTTKFDSDDWKIHFMTIRKFLIKQMEPETPDASENW